MHGLVILSAIAVLTAYVSLMSAVGRWLARARERGSAPSVPDVLTELDLSSGGRERIAS